MTVAELINILVDSAARGDCDLSSEVNVVVLDDDFDDGVAIDIEVDKVTFDTDEDGDVTVQLATEESIAALCAELKQ